jgi:hypothetical protein
MPNLTSRTLASGASKTDLIHIVIPSDTVQNLAGSSYKIPIGDYIDKFSLWTLVLGLLYLKVVAQLRLGTTFNLFFRYGINGG